MKEITITKYKANNGRIFDTQAECEQYEKELFGKFNNKYIDTKLDLSYLVYGGTNCGCGDDVLFVFDIKNHEDVEVLKNYLTAYQADYGNGHDKVTDEYIGHKVLVGKYSYEDGAYLIGTKEEVLKNYSKTLDEIFNKE